MFFRPQEKLLNTAIRLGGRLRGALRAPAADGQLPDGYPDSDELEANGDDNIDILKYLESITAEESLRGNDLTKYKVVLTNVEIVQVSLDGQRCRAFVVSFSHGGAGQLGAVKCRVFTY